MITDTAVPSCPSCGSPRVNTAKSDATPLYECHACGEIESPLVGIVTPDYADALAPPPEDEPEDPFPPDPSLGGAGEPEDDLEPAPDPEPREEPPAAVVTNPSEPNGGALRPLMDLLPADFPLPVLARFVPDARIRHAADVDAAKLLAIEVTDETSLRVVEACITEQRAHKQTIEALFEEPVAIAYALHKHLTGLRAEWLTQTTLAIGVANTRVLTLQRKLAHEAAEARRRAQEEADRQARADRRREAEAAQQAQAPAAVVEQLQFEAETAVAPPVPQVRAPVLRSSSVVANWKSRLASTDRAAEDLQPPMAKLTPAQLEDVYVTMRAVLEQRAPITAFEINYSVTDQRAGSDKKTFAIPGFVAEDLGSIRAKPGRRK